MERLQKVIANSGYTSRRKAEELIVAGKVKVNDQVVVELGIKVSKNDKIKVEGQIIVDEEKVFYILNKPKGYISSVNDDLGRRVVVDLIKTNVRIFPVGRLDYDTTGVLLLTNDGELTNKLIHPKYHLEKEYLATVNGIFTKREKKLLERGVDIGFKAIATNVRITNVNFKVKSTQVYLTINEGKYHQVKRMFEEVGTEVKNLKRIRFGNITCDGMKIGEYRKIKPHEKKILVDLINNNKKEK